MQQGGVRSSRADLKVHLDNLQSLYNSTNEEVCAAYSTWSHVYDITMSMKNTMQCLKSRISYSDPLQPPYLPTTISHLNPLCQHAGILSPGITLPLF